MVHVIGGPVQRPDELLVGERCTEGGARERSAGDDPISPAYSKVQ